MVRKVTDAIGQMFAADHSMWTTTSGCGETRLDKCTEETLRGPG